MGDTDEDVDGQRNPDKGLTKGKEEGGRARPPEAGIPHAALFTHLCLSLQLLPLAPDPPPLYIRDTVDRSRLLGFPDG